MDTVSTKRNDRGIECAHNQRAVSALVLNVEAASRPPTQRRAATAAAAALSDLK